MTSGESRPITALLLRWRAGEEAAREELVPLVYDELRRVARRCLAGRQPGQTLQSTELVHEAYLRLVDGHAVNWNDRVHFFAVAAQMMRSILVDHIRMRRAAKRGGNCVTLMLDDAVALPQQRAVDVIALDDALNGLATLDARQSRLVELRFFGGLSIEETSLALGISPATVKREWATARAWLHQEMHGAPSA
jgi:RNA polymerase sigma factor (TIGR02999 family)